MNLWDIPHSRTSDPLSSYVAGDRHHLSGEIYCPRCGTKGKGEDVNYATTTPLTPHPASEQLAPSPHRPRRYTAA